MCLLKVLADVVELVDKDVVFLVPERLFGVGDKVFLFF